MPPRRPRRDARQPREGWIGSLGKALKTTGAKAEQYAKLGVAKAEREKAKLSLRSAHAELGKAVLDKWEAGTEAVAQRDDPDFAPLLEKIEQLRRRMAAVEAKMEALRASEQRPSRAGGSAKP